jgi:hypothetical protein
MTLIAMTIFSLAYPKTINVEKDRYSWYENYIDNPDLKDEMEHMDDQLLGEHKNSEIRGLILDIRTMTPIHGAKIQVRDEKKNLIKEIASGKMGYYALQNMMTDNTFFTISVSAEGYTNLTKILNKSNHFYGLDFHLLKKTSRIVDEISTVIIADETGKIELTVPTDILKRIDNKSIRYPIRIAISYIAPKEFLSAMPGIDMLTQEKGNIIRPLLSSGAALLEAFDRDNIELRIDREKEVKLGKTTSLKMILPDFITQKNQGQIQFWSFDPLQSLSWNPIDKPIIDKTNSSSLDLLNTAFLDKYINNIINRLKADPQSTIQACFEPNSTQSAQDMKKNQNTTLPELRKNLLSYILNDLYNMRTTYPEITLNCLQDNEISSDSFYGVDPSMVFDLKYKNKWYSRTQYNKCGIDSSAPYFFKPYLLSSDFDYKPLLALKDSICSLLEKNRWDNAITIKSIDLVPFNLDKPTNGVPVLFEFLEKNKDGRFEVKIEITSDNGIYSVTRLVYSPKKPALINLLLPDEGKLKIWVKSEFNQTDYKLLKEYPVPKATDNNSYIWDNQRTKIQTKSGKEPKWIKQPLIEF